MFKITSLYKDLKNSPEIFVVFVFIIRTNNKINNLALFNLKMINLRLH